MDVQSTSEKEECIICLEEEGEWRTLGCQHRYHAVCIEKWMRVNERCPVCMRNIPEMEMEERHYTILRRYLLFLCSIIGVIIIMVLCSSRRT
jgi:hypothetical protein